MPAVTSSRNGVCAGLGQLQKEAAAELVGEGWVIYIHCSQVAQQAGGHGDGQWS